ncbi:MAG: hypothetical protein JNK65_04305, partial [Deltaproteobacteria bacterium]|nr:hypothetical protein [Deltaproteobacteria bacterium]
MPGDHFVIGSFNKPGAINPLTTQTTISANLVDLVFDSLIDLDENYQLRPLIAERWTISEEGKIWTFYLKKGIFFHDGKELTAEDVAYTFQLVSKEKNQGYYYLFSHVLKMEAVDRYTFQVTLNEYDHAFWGAILSNNI